MVSANGNDKDQRHNTGILTKLVHGFSASIYEESEGQSSYEEPRGVGIRIEALNKSFGDNHVLKDINLEILPGETFSIIGPSGTGKSVLLKHIVKLEKPDSGHIFIDNQDIYEPNPEGERRNFRYSMVFQSSALFNSLSVGENVGLWLREKRVCAESRIRRIIREKLRLVGLEGKEELMTSELSGGMRKRVAIARSLAMKPGPDSLRRAELDPVTSDELARVIQNLKKQVNLTTVIVSHDLNFALYLSDRVAMISEGRIVEVGTPEEIKASKNPVVRNFIYTTTKGIKGED